MKKRDLIISPDSNDDANEEWMIHYDPDGTRRGNHDEWERVLEETRGLAKEAEAGSVSQMRVGNRLVRHIWLLFSKQKGTERENEPLGTHPVRRPPTLGDVEDALKHLFDVHALSQNPLAHALYLSRHERGNDPPALAPGHALHRALIEALDQVTGAVPRSIYDGGLRVEHYLHFHYREEISNEELAGALGYNPRYLRTLRQDRIRRFAEVLRMLNMPPR